MSYTILIPKSSITSINGIIKLMKGVNSKTVFTDKDKKELGLRLNTRIQDNIDSKLDVFGRPMTPLSPKTYNRKKPPRGGPSATPLKDTATLYGNIKFEVKGNIIKLFNNTQYLKYHQEGTEYIPKRQIYPEGAKLPSPIQELLDQFIEKRVASNIEKILKK